MDLFSSAGQSPAFFTGVAFGALLLCAGLAIGLWLGRHAAADAGSHRAETERLGQLVSHIVNWSQGMAQEMSEYRAVIHGVSRLFQGVDGALEESNRTATIGVLSQFVDANEKLQKRLNRAESMLKYQAVEISTYISEARTDPLTGLPNRRAFDEELKRRMAEWSRHQSPLSLLIADIDDFKRLNDMHGHPAGDAVLAEVSRTMVQAVRESGIVARIGGEEIAVLLPNCTAQAACRTAEQARIAVEQARCEYDGKRLPVTVSIGVAQLVQGEEVPSLLRRADDALYAAKEAGRNVACWHDGNQCLPAGYGRVRQRERLTEPAEDAYEADCGEFMQVCAELRQRLKEVATP